LSIPEEKGKRNHLSLLILLLLLLLYLPYYAALPPLTAYLPTIPYYLIIINAVSRGIEPIS
jgi:hypothetical protein